jgi:hypothetical protein
MNNKPRACNSAHKVLAFAGFIIGYGKEFLRLGAGFYQIVSRTSKGIKWISSYFDDPVDSFYIGWGFDDFRGGMYN